MFAYWICGYCDTEFSHQFDSHPTATVAKFIFMILCVWVIKQFDTIWFQISIFTESFGFDTALYMRNNFL